MKKAASHLILLSGLALTSSSVVAGPAVINIGEIIGQSKSVVETKLGKPASCSNSKYGPKCSYQKGQTDIVFINSKADWITVNAIAGVPFSQTALASLGLTVTPPSFQNANVMRWTNIPGILELALFPGPTGVDYAYIKVATK
jgi:hypothetical protein